MSLPNRSEEDVDLKELIQRWNLRIEPYSDFDSTAGRNAKVVYAAIRNFQADLLLAIIHEDRVQNCANELIDEFLKEFDPIRAAQLLDDMEIILNKWDELEALLEKRSALN